MSILAYSNFILYALHYVIVRTIYDNIRAQGITPVQMVGGAVALIVLFTILKRTMGGGRKSYKRESPRENPRRAYRLELAKLQAKRDSAEMAEGKKKSPRWWRW